VGVVNTPEQTDKNEIFISKAKKKKKEVTAYLPILHVFFG